jgi:hypothetical protein
MNIIIETYNMLIGFGKALCLKHSVYFNSTFWMINGIVWAFVAALFVLGKRELYLNPKR